MELGEPWWIIPGELSVFTGYLSNNRFYPPPPKGKEVRAAHSEAGPSTPAPAAAPAQAWPLLCLLCVCSDPGPQAPQPPPPAPRPAGLEQTLTSRTRPQPAARVFTAPRRSSSTGS